MWDINIIKHGFMLCNLLALHSDQCVESLQADKQGIDSEDVIYKVGDICFCVHSFFCFWLSKRDCFSLPNSVQPCAKGRMKLSKRLADFTEESGDPAATSAVFYFPNGNAFELLPNITLEVF